MPADNKIFGNTTAAPFGGQVISINTSAYLIQGSFSPTLNTREIERRDAQGDVIDLMLRGEPATVSCTLEFASSSTPMVYPGDKFSYTFTGDSGGDVDFIITQVVRNITQGEYHNITITARTVAGVKITGDPA